MSDSQIVSDIELISAGLSSLLSAATAISGKLVPPEVLGAVTAALSAIHDNAGKIAADGVADPTKIQAIAGAVSVISQALAPFLPAAPGIGMAISAALALLRVALPGRLAAEEGAISPAKARLHLEKIARSGIHPDAAS